MRIITFFMLLGCSVAFGQEEGVIYFKFQDSIVETSGIEKYSITFTNEETKQEYVLTNSFDILEKQKQRLPKGNYTMLLQSDSYQEYEMAGIPVHSDKITFLEAFELEKKLENKQKTIKKYEKPVSKYKFCG